MALKLGKISQKHRKHYQSFLEKNVEQFQSAVVEWSINKCIHFGQLFGEEKQRLPP